MQKRAHFAKCKIGFLKKAECKIVFPIFFHLGSVEFARGARVVFGGGSAVVASDDFLFAASGAFEFDKVLGDFSVA